jgi:hypothetical protein
MTAEHSSVADMHALRPPELSLHAAVWIEGMIRAVVREHGREAAISVADELKTFIGQKVSQALADDPLGRGDFDTLLDQ